MITLVREKFPHFANQKIGFAGRLDPMAHGVLLLLVGDANFERDNYLDLDKTYQFTALLGLETDSYDLLGLLTSSSLQTDPIISSEVLNQFVKETIGKHTQPYPPFSSKPIHGKQLFKWARENKLADIEIPTKDIEIYDLKVLDQSTISSEALQKLAESRITKIEGIFRQEQILEKWTNFFALHPKQEFKTISFEVKCSSGTYVRSIVHNLGQKLGWGATTLEIYRTKVGSYNIEECLEII